ncbi:alpha/beta hydrolase [Nocardia sp. CDC153]|uniref:alpha/beta fold hydrolase n=1 Tax=Nocardia sp. CDC153 TaxID=3112167 RepID=UPI002DBCA9B0|nr:alpha/beta hydrolase [Nocardia sp. CDC153]MEC3957608.1 alpha/beta hydrolase [Nocardia sp. CDC153]
MSNNTIASANTTWTGLIDVEDTALACTDTGGSGIPVVYLNGSYATQKNWKKVIADLGPGFRHITFDERARGKSATSSDYSFDACVRDVDAVLAARGIADQKPILVGWSYGALVAVHWADRNPGRLAGVVSADGAMPWGLTDEADIERIRAMFAKMGPMMWLLRPLQLAARMSPTQHAEVNIELNRLCADLAPVLDRLTTPVRYVMATGANFGASEEEIGKVRASLEPLLLTNPHLTVSARVGSNHSKILAKDFHAVADAVRETAAALGEQA